MCIPSVKGLMHRAGACNPKSTSVKVVIQGDAKLLKFVGSACHQTRSKALAMSSAMTHVVLESPGARQSRD